MAIKRTRNSGLTVPELVKPTPGKSTDSWGLLLNENIDKQTLFNTKLVQDSETQNQEIKRLDREKVSTSDIPTIVEPIVIQEVETIGKPMLEEYMTDVLEPQLDTYTSGKKGEIDNYVNLTSKPSLDSYEKVKENELNSYTTTKKGELDSHTSSKQTQLDNYEKTKETQLNSYTSTKQTQLDDYTVVKKGELDTYTSEKKSQLDSYEKAKEGELDSYNVIKKSELDTYEKSKESELDTYTAQKKSDLDSYERTKEGELDAYTVSKKEEITSHTDSEILRIQGEGSTQIDKVIAEGNNQLDKIVEAGEGLAPRVEDLEADKLDKGGYTGTALDLKNLIDSKPNTEVVAGQGLKSSQVGNKVTVSIDSADEGILVNENNIQLNVVNDLTTGGIKRPLSAEQGKVLKQLIDTLGGGGTTSLLRQARILGDADYIGTLSASAVDIVVGSKLNKPTLYLDGTRMDSTTYSVELNLGKITLNEAYADYDATWVVEDEFPSHIRFSYPTLSLLQADEQIKSIINVGDVIEILGESDADDGGQRLVKCSNQLGLNGVSIGNGKYLNEIPNSKPSDKVDKSDIVDNLTTADKSKVLSANIGASINSRLTTYRQIKIEGDSDTFYPVRIRLSNDFNSINLLISKFVHSPTTNDGSFRLNIYNITHRAWGEYPYPAYNVVYSGDVKKHVYNFYASGNQGRFFVILLRGGGRQYTFSSEKEILDGIEVYYENVEISGSQEGFKLYEEPRTGESLIGDRYDSYSSFRAVETMRYLGGVATYVSVYNSENKTCISYIQDEGQKTAGNGYVDKVTGKLYLCKTTTSDTSVTTNFVLATNIDIAKQVYGIS